MGFLIVKYLVTAGIIVAVSEVAKRSDKLGALIISLPIMTIITLFWLNFENQSEQKISNHAYYTFWYVVPTLPMFLTFPLLMRHFGFGNSMLISLTGTAALLGLTAFVLNKFDIKLL